MKRIENCEFRICTKCGIKKPITEFYKQSRRPCGYQNSCKLCQLEINKLWVKNNKERHSKNIKKWSDSNRERRWAYMTIMQHKKKYDVSLTLNELIEYISHKHSCEICGKPLSFVNKKILNDSPSLDRIDNEQSITKDNIQLVCIQCNTTKGSRTQIEFEEYCKLILRRKGYDI
jgi:hypothetical protein